MNAVGNSVSDLHPPYHSIPDPVLYYVSFQQREKKINLFILFWMVGHKHIEIAIFMLN